MVGIACSGALEAAAYGVGCGPDVEAAESDRRIEGLKGGEIKLVEDLLTDSGTERIIRVGSDDDPSPFKDRRGHIDCRASLHVREGCSQAEKVSVGSGNLHAGNDQESVNGRTILSDQSGGGQVLDGFTGVMVGDGDAAQPACFGCLHHVLGRTACVRRIMGVKVQVEGVKHR